MSKENKKLIIMLVCSILLIVIALLWISTIPEGTPGLLEKPKPVITASETDVATVTDCEPQTFYKRYGIIEQPIYVDDEIESEDDKVYIPSPALSEMKEPEMEIEIVTTEEQTTEVYVEEEPQIEVEQVEVVETSESAGMIYIGTYFCTGYVATGNPCANGNYPTVGYTIASNSLPMGTTVYIDGLGTRVVEDTGGMSTNVIDVFVGSVDEAYAITGNYEVYIYE